MSRPLARPGPTSRAVTLGAPMRVLGFGAGRQTVALARMSLDGAFGLPMVDAMVFSDTGDEVPETYRAADQIEAACHNRGVRFVRVRNTQPRSCGHLLSDLMEPSGKLRAAPPLFLVGHRGKRGFSRRQCTKDYKVEPVQRALRELAGIGRRRKFPVPVVEHWMGISADEMERMKDSTLAWRRFRYPLVELRLSAGDCIAWLGREGYEVPVKSACFYCPFQSDRRWLELRDGQPELWAKAVALDEHLRGEGRPIGLRGTPYLHHSRRPLAEARFDETGDMFADECHGVCGV